MSPTRRCPRCRGTGLLDRWSDQDCDYCDGDGEITTVSLVAVSEADDVW